MRFKILTIAIIIPTILLVTGCSVLENVAYHPNVNRGNHFITDDISKIYVGMNQPQVAYSLGTPMLTDPFGTNTWFYVFYQKLGHKRTRQQTISLTFDNKGILVDITSIPISTKTTKHDFLKILHLIGK